MILTLGCYDGVGGHVLEELARRVAAGGGRLDRELREGRVAARSQSSELLLAFLILCECRCSILLRLGGQYVHSVMP